MFSTLVAVFGYAFNGARLRAKRTVTGFETQRRRRSFAHSSRGRRGAAKGLLTGRVVCRTPAPLTLTPGTLTTAATMRTAVRCHATNWSRRGTASCGAASCTSMTRSKKLRRIASVMSAPRSRQAVRCCPTCRYARSLSRRLKRCARPRKPTEMTGSKGRSEPGQRRLAPGLCLVYPKASRRRHAKADPCSTRRLVRKSAGSFSCGTKPLCAVAPPVHFWQCPRRFARFACFARG